MSDERDSDGSGRFARAGERAGGSLVASQVTESIRVVARQTMASTSGDGVTSGGSGHRASSSSAVSISITVSVTSAEEVSSTSLPANVPGNEAGPESEPEPPSLAPSSSSLAPPSSSAPFSASPHSTPIPPRRSAPARPRRRRPWLLVALAGTAGLRVCGELEPQSGAESAARSLAPSSGNGSLLLANVDGPFSASTFGSSSLVGLAPGSVPGKNRMRSEHAGVLEAAGIPVGKGELEPIQAPESFDLTARPLAPGRTWQDAANAADWPAVALLIDMLPESDRGEPGARYARAVAARELGQCDTALVALAGLESELPILTAEITSLRAHCQLEVGPYEAAYLYFNDEQTPESLTLAARAAVYAGDLPKAEQTIDRALRKLDRNGNGKRGLGKEISARALRASILEARGQPALAAREWLWLATQAATDPLGATADDTYEKLSGTKLDSVARLARMQTFAREGQLDRTLREYARLASAPGPAPARVEISAALAWAYYYSRSDYSKAAQLFRQAADDAADTRVKYLFFEARALSRAYDHEGALAAYRDLSRRYPGSAYTEQVYYRIARVEYERGAWENAERAYTDYLDRYARSGGGKYTASSRYELAISRIGAKERTEEAAAVLGQMARKERRTDRRLMLTHLEAVALEGTGDPTRVQQAVARYRSLIEERPLSFAAMASAARLRALGSLDGRRGLGHFPVVHTGPLSESPRLPEKARFLAEIGLHTDAERALFDERQSSRAAADGQELCDMYGALDRGFRSYVVAERLLKRDDLGRLPSADNIWAWRCKYPEPYRGIVSAVEARYHLPDSLVHAVMRQESGFRPNVVSPVGAIGLMQLMPNTARRAAEEIMQQPGAPWVPDPNKPTNVLNNVELGGYYLGKLLNMLGGQLPVAVAAYNAGPIAVSSWLAGGEDLPMDVWVARIPYTETRDYVSIVLGNWIAYRYLGDPDQLPDLTLAMIPGTRAAPDAY
jgi:soluble lytic murein transglycosylase